MQPLTKSEIHKLRTRPSAIQGLAPRKTLCKQCPHTHEVRTHTCHIGDQDMFALEEPHGCHSEKDGLCRGTVEKMIRNGVSWKLNETEVDIHQKPLSLESLVK